MSRTERAEFRELGGAPTSPGLRAYRAGTLALTPFAHGLLLARARRGREDLARLDERLGRAALPRPEGPLVWLHGASIGEGLSLLPLVDALRSRRFATLLTTGTRTSADVVTPRLPAGALHQFAPLDIPQAVGAFLDHWRPNLLLLAESELWPNMLGACVQRAIPVAIVNGRMSHRSQRRWSRAPRAASALLGGLATCLVQSDEEAARFDRLGAHRPVVVGNLKHDLSMPPVDDAELACLRASVGTRPVLLAASTHPGDEELLLAAHRTVQSSDSNLLTILVPRDILRGRAICDLAERAGLCVAQRSRETRVTSETSVLVADTVGEMGLWLRLASLVVIGKTFGRGGGQTPLEAARCHVPILHGPSTGNFADMFAALDQAGGACCVSSGELAHAIAALFEDPARARAMARAAARVADAMTGATQRTLDILEPLLARANVAPA